MKKTILILAATALLVSCKENQTNDLLASEEINLQAKIDSMQNVLNENAYQIGVLEQVSMYMDSIDANRKWIKLNLETGIAEEDYVERMKSISMYMQKAEWTIGELEKTRSAYASQVKRLKATVEAKDAEINMLQLSVAQIQKDNDTLDELLTVSQDQLQSVSTELSDNEIKLAAVENEVEKLKSDIQLTKAEAAYAQAEGMEELASKIHLSKKKKEETLNRAMDLYKTSKELGYEPATKKVDQLSTILSK